MKKKIFVGLTALFTAVFVFVGGFWIYQANKPIDESEVMEIYSFTDYLYTKPEDLYERAEYVFIGEMGDDIRTYIPESTQIRTIANVKVLEIFKGVPPEEMEISYLGGTVTYTEYLESRSEVEQKNMLEEYQTNANLRQFKYVRKQPGVDIDEGNKYLFFLIYGEFEDGYYVPSSDHYSIIPLTADGKKVYRQDPQKYETLDEVVSRMYEASEEE